MAFALIFVGLILIVTGVRDTYAQLGSQITSDFSGNKSFLLWIAAIGGVGAIGYIRDLQEFSRWFMALIIISLLINNQGFFTTLLNGLKVAPVAPKPGAVQSSQTFTQSVVSSGAPINSDVGTQINNAGTVPAPTGNFFDNFKSAIGHLFPGANSPAY